MSSKKWRKKDEKREGRGDENGVARASGVSEKKRDDQRDKAVRYERVKGKWNERSDEAMKHGVKCGHEGSVQEARESEYQQACCKEVFKGGNHKNKSVGARLPRGSTYR